MTTTVARRKPVETHRLKVSISMNPTLLRLVDERAGELDVSRSLIVQLALREYFK